MKKIRIALALLAVLLIILTWRFGGFALISNPERLRETLLGLGPWGYVAFVAAFAILQPLGLPGIGFVVGAAYVWPGPVAFALSLTGSIFATAVGFGFARFVARDWVSKKLPARLRKYDAKIEKNGFLMAIVLRAIFLMHPLLHALFGISRIRFVPYMVGSTIGYLPGIALATWVSGNILDYLKGQPKSRFIAIGVGLLVLYVVRIIVQRWYKKRYPSPDGDESKEEAVITQHIADETPPENG